MKHAEKVLTGVVVLAVGGLVALATPAVAGLVPSATEPTSEATPVRVEAAPEPDVCAGREERSDPGKQAGANGLVEATDADGLATVYFVAPNDTLLGIAARFCMHAADITSRNQIPYRSHILAGDYYALTDDAKDEAFRLKHGWVD